MPSAKPLAKTENREIKWKFTKCSSGFQAKIWCTLLISLGLTIRRAHLNLSRMNLVPLGRVYKLQSSSLCNFLRPPVLSKSSPQHFFLQHLNLCSSEQNPNFHTRTKRVKYAAYYWTKYMTMFRLLDRKQDKDRDTHTHTHCSFKIRRLTTMH